MIKDFETAVRIHEKSVYRGQKPSETTENMLAKTRKELEETTPGEKDSAIIFRYTGPNTFTMVHIIPDQDPDELTPAVTTLASMISILISNDDEDFIGLIYKKFKEYMAKID